MSHDRDAVAHRIRSLLTKTVENGCTEEEAILAAQKARELMDKYRLSQSDIEIQREECIKREWQRAVRSALAATDYCMRGIEAYCGVKMWLHGSNKSGQMVRTAVAFGLRDDVEMAEYLYGLIRSAIHSEKNAYVRAEGALGRKVPYTGTTTWSFMTGMAERINRRLLDMAAALDGTARTGSGTALVVVKNAVVNEAYAKLGLRLKSMAGRKTGDGDAYAAGSAAGDRVNLNRPVRGTKVAGRLT